MPDIFSILGGDPTGGEMPGGGINNLASFTATSDPMGIMAGSSPAAATTPGLNPGAMNILQALNPPAAAPADPDPGNALPLAVATTPAATASAPAGTPTPRHRMSALDVIGRVSDVLAKVGGAQALYQPTLDAREDRALGLADHARSVDLDQLKMAQLRSQLATSATTADQGNAGKAIQAIQALVKNGGNAANAWATYAKFNGVSPELMSHVQDILNSDPDGSKGALDSLDNSLNGIEEYAQPAQLETDKDGNTVLVQYGKHGGTNVIKPEDGYSFTPANAIQVDAGGKRVLIDPRTHQVVGSVDVTAHPDTIANNQTKITTTRMADASREAVANIGARSRETVATTRGTGKTGTAADPSSAAASTANVNTLLDNIERGFRTLHGQNALAGDTGGSVTGGISNALQRLIPGANKVAEQMGGDSSPAQTRLLMEKDVNSLQSEMVKSLPASATRTKFEQEIQRKRLPDPNRMSFSTGMAAINDLRSLHARIEAARPAALAEAAASRPAPARTSTPAPARRILPAPAGTRARAPVVNNW